MAKHMHEWDSKAGWGANGLCCMINGCDAEMTWKEMSRRLNEYETLKAALSVAMSENQRLTKLLEDEQ